MKRHAVYALLFLLCLSIASYAWAETADDIRAKIDAQTTKIIQLEKEIKAFEATLLELSKNKTTLQSEVTRLDTQRKKLGTDIAVTLDKVKNANLEIERLSGEIGAKEDGIALGKRGIKEALNTLGKYDDLTLIEQYYSASGLTGFWEDTDLIRALQNDIHAHTIELANVKLALSADRDTVSEKRSELTSLSTQLKGQKAVLDQNRQEQSTLLTQTKANESNFQKLLKEKQAARIQFEAELNQYESQLKYTLDPSSLPAAGKGVLGWPLDPAFMSRCAERQSVFKNLYCITQFFGHTAFSQSGAYNGAAHNGVDFGSPEGTRVVAALSGSVEATGNTDVYKGCYSYGKWVLVRHANGLSTLYAHLSYISVGQGDTVPTGGMLGYSGKTGYATGPHLHFTLFASDGVKLVKLGDIKSKTNCSAAIVPIAATSAYLDPLSYL